MKTTAINYIYDKYNERGMKAFEKKVAKLLKDNGIKGDIVCHNAYMKRGNGYNSYFCCAEIEVNKDILELKYHTNNSEAWDNWENPTGKDKRQLFLSVLEACVNDLKGEDYSRRSY